MSSAKELAACKILGIRGLEDLYCTSLLRGAAARDVVAVRGGCQTMNVQFAGVGESSYLVRRVYVQGVLEPPARDALVDFSSGGHARLAEEYVPVALDAPTAVVPRPWNLPTLLTRARIFARKATRARSALFARIGTTAWARSASSATEVRVYLPLLVSSSASLSLAPSSCWL